MEKTQLSKKDKSWFEGIFSKYFPTGPTSKIIQDANGKDLDFTEIEDDATPKVGDAVKVGGEKTTEDYTMPSGEVWKVEDGVLTEIVPKDEDNEDEVADLKKEVADLKTKLIDADAKLVTSDGANAKMLDDIKEIKSKVTSSFEWEGKTKKDGKSNGPKTRTFTPKNQLK